MDEVAARRVDPGGTDPRWRITPTKIAVAGILLVGIVAPLLVGTYDRVEPRLFGFPFFYWYQLLWVFIAAALCALSFWLLRRERLAHERRTGTGEQR
ncbi:Protein of unknown function [Friedmanniella luteola]|uniref:Uncharacterized protein n=1 Tax=Friedmanniella luteola TaxID=546871 RepID=A0A1H1VBD8_9ACTN|nr:DUF3311 domain-containing protein [Friedmanniella luteola]SDS81539.1 Protein of unknown function [Friedmanniella luteola]